jgi:hypothetical protein
MRLSDARMRLCQTKLLYLNHRLPPWLTEDATRDRSNRLLDAYVPLNRAFYLSLVESSDDANNSIFRSLALTS